MVCANYKISIKYESNFVYNDKEMSVTKLLHIRRGNSRASNSYSIRSSGCHTNCFHILLTADNNETFVKLLGIYLTRGI